jgi:hypothetical protein
MKWKACLAGLAAAAALCFAADNSAAWTKLFPEDGIPKGWYVTEWSDVAKKADEKIKWKVIDGVLHGSDPRGTWLVSEKEYGDFELEFEWKIGPRGNSGCGLRFPAAGDPAFDGLELQMCDPRYYGDDAPKIPKSELTGSLYRAVEPKVDIASVFKPEDWNKYEVKLVGSKVNVRLNGKEVQNYDLNDHTAIVHRHAEGQTAVPLKDRPRKGHIGFQELSRGGGHVEIRNARIRESK